MAKKEELAPHEHAHLAEHHSKMAAHHMKFAKGGMAMDASIERGEKKRPHGEHAIQERGKTRAMQEKMKGNTVGMKKGGAVRRK